MCLCCVCESVFVLRAPLIERTKCKRKEKELKTIINTHNKMKFLLCFENTWMSLICPRTHKNIQKKSESTWRHPKHRCGWVRHKWHGSGESDANRKLVTTKTLEGCMHGMINHNLSELSTTFMTQKESKRSNSLLSSFFSLSPLYSNKLLS